MSDKRTFFSISELFSFYLLISVNFSVFERFGSFYLYKPIVFEVLSHSSTAFAAGGTRNSDFMTIKVTHDSFSAKIDHWEIEIVQNLP